jgi:hypothetical protein
VFPSAEIKRHSREWKNRTNARLVTRVRYLASSRVVMITAFDQEEQKFGSSNPAEDNFFFFSVTLIFGQIVIVGSESYLL